MSFSDELRKKSEEYDPKAIRNREIQCRIEYSVTAIKKSCEEAAKKGERRIDGLVHFDEYDGKFHYVRDTEVGTGFGILLEGFTDEEERKILEGIREKTKEFNFNSCVIKSYHPKRVISGSKRVNASIFRPDGRVYTYRQTYGFCIEAHIKW